MMRSGSPGADPDADEGAGPDSRSSLARRELGHRVRGPEGVVAPERGGVGHRDPGELAPEIVSWASSEDAFALEAHRVSHQPPPRRKGVPARVEQVRGREAPAHEDCVGRTVSRSASALGRFAPARRGARGCRGVPRCRSMNPTARVSARPRSRGRPRAARIHSMPTEPHPAPTSQRSCPGKGARAASAAARTARLVSCPSCSKASSGRPGVRARSGAVRAGGALDGDGVEVPHVGRARTRGRWSRGPARPAYRRGAPGRRPGSRRSPHVAEHLRDGGRGRSRRGSARARGRPARSRPGTSRAGGRAG